VPDDLVVNEHMPALKQNRILLTIGRDRGWWIYESENEPGHVDRSGNTYTVVTYTIRLPSQAADEERVLVTSEVRGYVLGTADAWGDEAVRAIAFRPGLVPAAGDDDQDDAEQV
jgi:hypothetical protein